jgi:hypothetical protein
MLRGVERRKEQNRNTKRTTKNVPPIDHMSYNNPMP